MNLPATSWARGIKLRARRLPGVGGWVQRDHPNLSGYLFIAPNMLGFLIFTGLAVVASLVLAFYDWDLLLGANFVGLANFGELFTEDDVFRSAFLNTVYFVVASVPLSVVAGLVTALLTAQSLRGMSLFRAIFLLPWITTTVAVSLVWKWMYLPKVGVVNQIIGALNIPGPAWLTDKTWAMPAIILMSVWKNFGFNTVLFLAGLQGIPQHLYDAASVDGATAWQRFRHVTVPMLSPTTFFVVIISIIGSFQVFDQALIMTAGGPGTSTTTLVLYVYQVGFQSYHMGMASAVAWVLTACVFVFTAGYVLGSKTVGDLRVTGGQAIGARFKPGTRATWPLFVYGMLVALAALTLVPLVWMLLAAFKSPTEVLQVPPSWWPREWHPENFRVAWNAVPFGRFILNTAFMSGGVAFVETATSALAAYAFARIKFRGRDVLFLAYLATLMVPRQVTVIPQFILMRELNWVDSYQGLILPQAFTAFGTFMLRQFFLTIPGELEDAARVDGASRLQFFRRILLPLSVTALATLFVLSFIFHWNYLLWPLIISNSETTTPVSVGIQLFQGQYVTEWHLLMAAATLATVPVVFLYVFMQKWVVRGIAETGFGGF